MTRTKTKAAAPELGTFEGDPVDSATIRVMNAGDGLSESLKTDPRLMHRGDEVFVVLRTKVKRVTFDPLDAADDQFDGPAERVHVLKTLSATIVDAELVSDALVTQEGRNAERREKEKGQGQLDGLDAATAALLKAHKAGKHGPKQDGMVDGCPECDEEAGLEATGTAERVQAKT